MTDHKYTDEVSDMKTEDKRKALREECDRYEKCANCPHTTKKWCEMYSIEGAAPHVIDAWYADLFGDDKSQIHQPTDEEVIRALELHSQEGEPCLDKCPYAEKRYCGSKMAKDACDLINRQRAEIESLNEIVFTDRTEAIKMLKTEAIKEFAERLKKEALIDSGYEVLQLGTIDTLVKEMTEGKPCTDGADCSTCEHCYHDGGYNECATDGVKL